MVFYFMKRGIILENAVIFILLVTSVSSCRKEVPSDKSLYIGSWYSSHSVGGANSTGSIIIESSGYGSYKLHSKKRNGSTSDESGEGNVKIKNGNLYIGIGPFRKKFSVYREPALTSNGTCTAVFGGDLYIRN